MASRCLDGLKQITVEPILFFSFLSLQTAGIVQQVGVYHVVCMQTYASRPEIDCANLANVTIDGVPAENTVQRQMSTWNMALSLAYMIPGIIADLFLGAYGDRYGRKVNMLLGMIGLMLSQFPLIVLFTYPLSVPIYVLVIANAIAGFTGYISITMISAFAYLTDTVLDPEQLTIRMSIMTVIMNVSMIIGPLIAGAVATTLTSAQGILLSQFFTVASFLLCMVLTHQVPPAAMRRIIAKKLEKKRQESSKEAPPEVPPTAPSGSSAEAPATKSFLATVIGLLKETWDTYTKPREGNIRLYLLVSAVAFFLYTISDGVTMTIITLFLQKEPLSWSQDMIGYYRSAQSAMLFIGTTVGILIFKKLFHFTDTFIMLISAVSYVAQILILAFTTTTWLAYVSAATGSLSMLSVPCIQSFLSKLVGPDEVGKAFTAFGLSFNIGFLVSNAIYNPIYAATLSFFPGFVFLFASALLFIASLGTLWMHVDMHFKSQSTDVEFWKRVLRSMVVQQEDAPVVDPIEAPAGGDDGEDGATVPKKVDSEHPSVQC